MLKRLEPELIGLLDSITEEIVSLHMGSMVQHITKASSAKSSNSDCRSRYIQTLRQ